eukprot:TRINITY_DN16358_c0_g1_i2.p1 TRINITY_DN16358_c0_g1~~TRINITY_DN16358_c0_g1_i2.p1  ORF type:complete len:349 (+),score=94.49 TRINITY_DN16358_c0_g1_i2:93-1139(+)
MMVCLCKRIRVAATLIAISADALLDMPLMFAIAPVTFLVAFAMFAPWVAILVLLASAGETSTNSTYGYSEYEYDDALKRAIVYWFFGLLWMIELTFAVGFMVGAFCVAVWFFAPVDNGVRPVPMCYISLALKKVLRYHLGTAALGSLIVAIIQFARFVLEYVEKKKDQYGGSDNTVVQFLFCMCRCCLWCLEKCVRWCNQQVYVQTIITNCWFCPGICAAMIVLIDNLSYILVCHSITMVVLFFARLAIALGTAAVCNYWLQQLELSSTILPTILILIIGFVVAGAFLSVYETTIDTMLLCFCEAKTHSNLYSSVPPELENFLDEMKQQVPEGTTKKDPEAPPKEDAT